MSDKINLDDLDFHADEQKIDIGDFDVIINVRELTKEVESLKWDKENYEYDKRVNEGDPFSMDEKTFNQAKQDFINDIKKLKTNVKIFVDKNIVLTKAGRLSKARKQVILQSNIVHEYYFHEGTNHEYGSPYIKAVQIDDRTIKLEYNGGINSQGL
jgi:hypothetical protein